MSMLSDRPIPMRAEDRAEAVRPRWEALVDEVVADVRRSFGDAIADDLASGLLRRTAEANSALAASFTAAEQRLDDTTNALAEIDDRIVALLSDATARHQHATTLRDEAAALLDEAAADRATAAALRQEAEELHDRASATHAAAETELARLQTERATLQAQLEDLQAPLDAREAELIAWEAELAERQRDNADSDAQFRLLRSQWRTLSDSGTASGAQRGWGRRGRSDDRNQPEAR